MGARAAAATLIAMALVAAGCGGSAKASSANVSSSNAVVSAGQINSGHHQRIAGIMRSLGWAQKRKNNKRCWIKI